MHIWGLAAPVEATDGMLAGAAQTPFFPCPTASSGLWGMCKHARSVKTSRNNDSEEGPQEGTVLELVGAGRCWTRTLMDGVAANGCETSLNTIDNCRRCGHACTIHPNPTATCTDRICYMTCNAGDY
jgi:hypothetical protein